MEHIAIMRPEWGFIDKIVSGQKRIESRWYMRKYPPWERIQPGEPVYFKNAGEPITAQAEVEKVLYFSDLTPQSIRTILETYAQEVGITTEQLPAFYERFEEKNYCMLIYLKNARRIQPFEIDKRGFGMQAVWLCVESVASIASMRKSNQTLDSHAGNAL